MQATEARHHRRVFLCQNFSLHLHKTGSNVLHETEPTTEFQKTRLRRVFCR